MVHRGRLSDGVVYDAAVSDCRVGVGSCWAVFRIELFGVLARSAWRRWIVDLLDMGFFHESQEGKLSGVGDD